MTGPAKKIKNAAQDAEAKIQTSKDHAEGRSLIGLEPSIIILEI
jgi:hypothetical protein